MGVGDLLHLVGQYGYLAAFFMLKGGLRILPLFTEVRRSGILRTSSVRSSRKFAPGIMHSPDPLNFVKVAFYGVRQKSFKDHSFE
jgi:hypothetical protein